MLNSPTTRTLTTAATERAASDGAAGVVLIILAIVVIVIMSPGAAWRAKVALGVLCALAIGLMILSEVYGLNLGAIFAAN